MTIHTLKFRIVPELSSASVPAMKDCVYAGVFLCAPAIKDCVYASVFLCVPGMKDYVYASVLLCCAAIIMEPC